MRNVGEMGERYYFITC